MARALAKTVHIDDVEHGQHVFREGTVPPEWAADLITNPKAWASDEDAEPEGEQADPAEDQGNGGTQVEPNRAGPGSGRDKWAAYASGKGIDVTDQMSRDDIMAAVDDLKS